MPDIHKLLTNLTAQEAQLSETHFLAPCARGGRVRTRVAGLVYTFHPRPRDFEGWGIFQPVDTATARLVEEAELPQVAGYLQRLPAVRLRLAHALRGQTWLSYPVNEADARQRWAAVKPVLLHLVTEGAPFEAVVAHWDGTACWFDEIDRRADPMVADQLREAQKALTPPEQLRFPGLTPEMRAVYDLAAQQDTAFQSVLQPRRDEERLQAALRLAGGSLREFHNRSDFWLVEWTTRDGERHTSAIGKRDLTVISAGICLSGGDRAFDLQSLVGVVERQWE
jgi:hypothetical protein